MKKVNQTIDFVEFPIQDTQEIAEVKRFYGTAFGWRFQDWGTDYFDTTSSGMGCGFNADTKHRPGMPLVVLYTEDLAEAKAKVLSAGGKLKRDIFSFPGGRRFHFTDPCGNELAIWSDK
jgi:hypothetical protein